MHPDREVAGKWGNSATRGGHVWLALLVCYDNNMSNKNVGIL